MSKSDQKTKTKQQTVQDPYAPTVPIIGDFLDQLKGLQTQVTPAQTQAFSQLESNAQEGNPYAPQLSNLAGSTLSYSADPQKGMLTDAYKTLQGQLSGYANGDYLDVANNPQIQAALKVAGDDAQDRINRMFAGSGRDLSGYNQQAVTRGVTQATAPILLDEFNTQQGNQMAAAEALANAAGTTSSGLTNADLAATGIQQSGIPITQSAIDASNYAPNTTLNLEQQQQELPFQNLGLLASLLLPTAGVGGTSNSTGTSKTSSSGFSIGDVGKLLQGAGSAATAFAALSDERAKDDIEPVGELADGQTVYRYRYKGDPAGITHIGLIAQEVEQEHPEAVGTRPDKLKAVDYGKATETAAGMVRSVIEKRGRHAA